MERAPAEPAPRGQAAIVEVLRSLFLNVDKQPSVHQPTYRVEIEWIWRLLAPASLALPGRPAAADIGPRAA